MINNNLFVGNSVTGNFRPEDEPQKEIHGYQIEKMNGNLYLVNDKERIKLDPVSKVDELIAKSFSDELGDLNESIYRLERCGELVILILYKYSETQNYYLNLKKSEFICSEKPKNKSVAKDIVICKLIPLTK